MLFASFQTTNTLKFTSYYDNCGTLNELLLEICCLRQSKEIQCQSIHFFYFGRSRDFLDGDGNRFCIEDCYRLYIVLVKPIVSQRHWVKWSTIPVKNTSVPTILSLNIAITCCWKYLEQFSLPSCDDCSSACKISKDHFNLFAS